MPITPMKRVTALGLLVTAAAVASCSNMTGTGQRSPVTLSVSSARSASASIADGGTRSLAPSGVAPLSDRTISGNGRTLILQTADLTLSDLRLDLRDGRNGEDSDSDGRHTNDGVFRSGPLTISLPLDGGVVTPLTGQLPVGVYDELEADLKFLRLRGTYDGQPFDVTLAINRELSLALRPPLVIDANGTGGNVTLNVNFFSCFSDAAGTPVDLRRLSQDSTLRDTVGGCIRSTLRAYRDRNRDGADSDSDRR